MKGGCILKSIQIKNVRSLKDTGIVSLPQISLLVGENSSGKSTFLRTFPLIKQSICKRTDGPLLWAGDVDDYVDFGSFSETVTNDNSESIEFQFEFPFTFDENSDRYYPASFLDISKPQHDEIVDSVKYSIVISQYENHEYVSSLQVHFNNTIAIFGLNPATAEVTINIDGVDLKIPEEKPNSDRTYFFISDVSTCAFGFPFPNVATMRTQMVDTFSENNSKSRKSADYLYSFHNIQVLAALQFIGGCFCRNMSFEEVAAQFKPKQSKSNKRQKGETANGAHVIDRLAQMPKRQQEQTIQKIKLLFLYTCLPQIDRYLNTYFRQVHYIAPLRATAERYYRLRNLAIDEVDYQGKNLAVFLNSLSLQQLTDFQYWTLQHFGFKVLPEKSGGHLSVKIALQKSGKAINLSDTGFGYSQILPIITQLWDLSTRKRSNYEKTVPLVIAIEQPELHLHPAIQARLTDAFIASIHLAERNGYDLQLLLETHSETIINRFGQAIAKGKLKNDDVSVILFNKMMDSNQTIVQTSKYDKDGYLTDWPIGFFAPQE